MQLCQDHVVTLESRPANIEGRGEFTIRELVINSCACAPTASSSAKSGAGRLLICAGHEYGHDGSISPCTPIIPGTPSPVWKPWCSWRGWASLKAIREQISSAIELIIHQTRFSDGSRITRISEVVGIENDSIVLQDIFAFRQEGVNEQGHVQGYPS